jgi:GT2 family glycosyltransferase
VDPRSQAEKAIEIFMSIPKLSISLVNTNNKVLLRDCLKSLFEQEHGLEFETILVDNVSTDGSVEMVAAEFPQVSVIRNEKRKGFAANHNQAISASKGELVLVLNEDTIVRPGTLKTMCDFMDSHPRTGALGPKLENPDGTLQKSCYRFPSPMRSMAENLMLVAMFPTCSWWGDYRAWDHDTEKNVDFVSGAAILVRRQVIETTGVLDERFFIYAEETDWCYRMHKDGWNVTFIPNATIVHFGGQSSVAIKDRQFCEFNRSAGKYIRKHYGLWGAIVMRVSMVLGALLRVPLFAMISLVQKSKRREETVDKLHLWIRLLRFWMGFGPYEGIAELAR